MVDLSEIAAMLGRAGGSVKGGRKARASRQNGKLGGRPRKRRPGARKRRKPASE